ncbi:MAG: hypothetical protein AAB622_02510 [Patescibacteria group bacterium]
MGKTKTAIMGEETNIKNKEKQFKAHKGEAEKIHVAGLKGGQRVKLVEAEIPSEEPVVTEEEKSNKKKIVEKVRSEKYKTAKAKFDNVKTYPVAEAISLIKDASYSKFDGTMELHLIVKKVGISAQVALPHAAGRVKKIEVADEKTLEKLKTGKIDFDILVATADMMPKLVPFAKLLGPRGLMPNPKNGTLVTDIKKAGAFSASTVTLKTEKEAPLIHTVVGKVSQKDTELKENIQAIFKALGGSDQILKVYLKSTMSPSVKVAIS